MWDACGLTCLRVVSCVFARKPCLLVRGSSVDGGGVRVPVLHGESSKRLAPPRNTKAWKRLPSAQTNGNRHDSQKKHQALSKGQPGSQDAQHQLAQQPCTPPAQQPPAIITHTQQCHHQIFPANAAAAKHRRAEPHHNTEHPPPQRGYAAPPAWGEPILRSG